MDSNKLTELINKLNDYKREIIINKRKLESEFNYIIHEEEIKDLNFGIFGSRINLIDIEDIANRLKIGEQTYEDCYVNIDYSVEIDGWDDTEHNVVTFKFFGDRRYTEEEVQKKKASMKSEIEKLEMKCKDVKNKIKELVVNG